MSVPITVGDLVTISEPPRAWRVVYVDQERGFARLEFAGEAWVRSKVVNLDKLQAYLELEHCGS